MAMLSEQEYVVRSLELNLFSGRIMKEHAVFLQAGFTPRDASLSREAAEFQSQFEAQLQNAVSMAGGIVSPGALRSGELFTDYTLGTEQKTQDFTGIPINRSITAQETKLQSGVNPAVTPELARRVRAMNAAVLPLLDRFIAFKERVRGDVLSCKLFTSNYPLLLEHIIREARTYRSGLAALESGTAAEESPRNTELFWDQIMMEHALFIRGQLDPTEGELINTANDFAGEYGELLVRARSSVDAMPAPLTRETAAATERFRDFKAAGTAGISECRIRSVILPLLADHVLREANRYLRLLG